MSIKINVELYSLNVRRVPHLQQHVHASGRIMQVDGGGIHTGMSSSKTSVKARDEARLLPRLGFHHICLVLLNPLNPLHDLMPNLSQFHHPLYARSIVKPKPCWKTKHETITAAMRADKVLVTSNLRCDTLSWSIRTSYKFCDSWYCRRSCQR